MQNPFGGRQPIGVIYNTSMSRPDAALALAELYAFQGKRESRMGAVCVVGAGLKTAIFCDTVARFFTPGQNPNANSALPVGLAAVDPLPPDQPFLLPALERKTPEGQVQFTTSIRRVTDTSMAEAVLRNGVIFNAEAVMVLSAPATYLARSLDLLGTKELYKERVKRLVIVDSGAPQQDVAALRKVLAEWPTPMFFCGHEVGEALPFPGASITKEFAWADAHPVVDAYRAFQAMPYDTPSHDLAAAHYAVHPDSGFFQLSDAGSVMVANDGTLKFVPGAGKVRALKPDAAQKDKIVQAMVDMASTKPVQPVRFQRPTNAKKDQ
ncbi:MAG: hypothetical protein ABI806_01245 [Candidatus Solibacter sp.]